jgi:hypothetical protein
MLMSSPHAIEVPAATLAALRDYAAVRHSAGGLADTGSLIRSEKPLTPAEREALIAALNWWRDQRTLADEQVTQITARLGRA